MESESPLVSIVMPSFNQVSYLETALRSVLEQDYTNVELIVIDGGSTDGSLEVLKKYAERLAYWQSRPDAGQADAINPIMYTCQVQSARRLRLCNPILK